LSTPEEVGSKMYLMDLVPNVPMPTVVLVPEPSEPVPPVKMDIIKLTELPTVLNAHPTVPPVLKSKPPQPTEPIPIPTLALLVLPDISLTLVSVDSVNKIPPLSPPPPSVKVVDPKPVPVHLAKMDITCQFLNVPLVHLTV